MSEVRLLTSAMNYAIVHLPGRQFPGVVFQGDSLDGLIKDLECAAAMPDGDQKSEGLAAIIEDLRGIRNHYEATLANHGFNLPYFSQG